MFTDRTVVSRVLCLYFLVSLAGCFGNPMKIKTGDAAAEAKQGDGSGAGGGEAGPDDGPGLVADSRVATNGPSSNGGAGGNSETVDSSVGGSDGSASGAGGASDGGTGGSAGGASTSDASANGGSAGGASTSDASANGGGSAGRSSGGGNGGTGGGIAGSGDAGPDAAPDVQPDVPDAPTDAPTAGAIVTGGTTTAAGGTTATGGTTSAGGATSAGGTTSTGGTTSSGGIGGSIGGTWAGTAPSCVGLAATCGPSGNESCCKSLWVPGGTYYRSYDGVTSTDKSFPATVADFYLDKYEITVGRFRQFVNAGMGTQASPPASGAGASPLITSSGWDSTWNDSLAVDTSALINALKCNSTFQTWTNTEGSSESRPQNCMDWYMAFAFCAWDGGRLATEAEWNYAAAGGSEQREYPWGGAAPDPSKASYYVDSTQKCMGDGVAGCTLADIIIVGAKPAGNGKWGQADLAGNVWEWTLDSYATYQTSCDNCADVVDSSYRVFRGGSFDDFPAKLQSANRSDYPLAARLDSIGSRCARTGP